jgi:hypothetical protein
MSERAVAAVAAAAAEFAPEDSQRAHLGDEQAKPSPLNVSIGYLRIFFGPASMLQRFNGSRHRRLNLKCLDAILFSILTFCGDVNLQ